MFFEDISAFSAYMLDEGGINRHSRTNYLSWLRFLSANHDIGATLDEEGVECILRKERDLLGKRSKYNSTKDLTNFRSALRLYVRYLNSSFCERRQQDEQQEQDAVRKNANLTKTEREQLISARVGQGIFRQKLVDYWHGCAVSRCGCIVLLVASHIKPWRVADNTERLDVYNGLLLLPTIDRLFDKGFITFNENGRIKISSFVPQDLYPILGISSDTHICGIAPRHLPYLDYHQNNCFIGL